MRYTTTFEGRFELDRPLTPAHVSYLKAFSATRRVKRHAEVTQHFLDPVRAAVQLPIGTEGAYYVGGCADLPNDLAAISDINKPPGGQPGLWRDWVPTEDGSGIRWNGREKFYDYVEWLDYLIEHFLSPWGYVLNGQVSWQGEREADFGTIRVANNRVVRLCLR